MSRWEFMRQLEELLSDISPSEREEALQYYNDYFNDAGRENEQEVIRALGTPEQVAKIVKDGLGTGSSAGSFTEYGFTSRDTRVEHPVSGTVEEEEKKKAPMPVWAIVLMVMGGILLLPVLLGVGVAGLGILFSIVATVLSFVLGMGAAAIGLLLAAVFLIVVGASVLFLKPLAAIGLWGAACISAALGLLSLVVTVLLIGKGLPALYKGILFLWRKIFPEKGGKKA